MCVFVNEGKACNEQVIDFFYFISNILGIQRHAHHLGNFAITKQKGIDVQCFTHVKIISIESI